MRLLVVWLTALASTLQWGRAADLAPQEIITAKKLYVVKCAKCHELYAPGSYSQKEWADWLQKMSRKSKLKPDQFELLSRYSDSLRRSSKTTP